MSKGSKGLLPVFYIFLFIAVLLLIFSNKLAEAGVDTIVLTGANILLFVLSVISFFIVLKGIRHSNPNVFVRSVMGSMMIKMVVCLVATFLYVYFTGDNYNKKSVFIALLLYLVYLSAEVVVLMKLNKNKNA